MSHAALEGPRDENSLSVSLGFDETKQKHQRQHRLQQAVVDDVNLGEDEAQADNDAPPVQPQPSGMIEHPSSIW